MKAFVFLLIASLLLVSNCVQVKERDSDASALKPSTVPANSPSVSAKPILVSQDRPVPSSDVTTFAITAPQGGAAVLKFDNGGDNDVAFTLQKSGSFGITNGKDKIITFNGDNSAEIGVDLLSIHSLQVNGQITCMGVPQWRQFVNENFWTVPTGWSTNEISTCGGLYLLGGYCILSRGNLIKEFGNLPTHQKIRITADFHYIDAWTGETAYMQLNTGPKNQDEYVWTDRYDSSMAVNSINVCGAQYGEGKLTTKIDITVPHNTGSIVVTFGSTVDQDPCDQSWGISNLSIYIQ